MTSPIVSPVTPALPSTFLSFGLHPDLLKGVQKMGFDKPTPIQELAIPHVLAGRDLLAAAMTGSGKTAAFLLPILTKLAEKPRGVTRVLVLSPTRELAAQIDEHLQQLAVFTKLSGAAVFGGVGMGPQEHAFRSGVDVIVATPGRLLDHFSRPYAKLQHLEVLVLDEADRMLDMGFLPDVRRVIRHLPANDRQTLLFSATLPAPIQTLAKEMMKNPVSIGVERQSMPATGITQAVYPVPQDLKPALLLALLGRGDIKSVIAFTRTKHRANRLFEFLEKNGVSAARIHGNRSQGQRTDALDGFRDGRYRILVATDIAARGIDVNELSHVVNVDVPHVPEDYVHRVGRTARAEATGEAYTFVSREEEADLRAIERAIGKSLPRVVVPGFDYTSKPSQFEVPIAVRIADIRARKATERARAKEKAERKFSQPAARPAQTFRSAPQPARVHTSQGPITPRTHEQRDAEAQRLHEVARRAAEAHVAQTVRGVPGGHTSPRPSHFRPGGRGPGPARGPRQGNEAQAARRDQTPSGGNGPDRRS
ncbi:MAG: DEAD/DEAH box helicase [Acidobacteria bacterium]|nr:DEAD/DEAH box helicase [Acidobacteriota bacterium]